MRRRTVRCSSVVSVLLALCPALSATAAPSPQPGIDPDNEPLVATFNCYLTEKGDAYATPSYALQVLPGRQYRTPFGDGAFTVDPTEILSITWTSGPLANTSSSATNFNDLGQQLSFVRVADGRSSYCNQQGPRDLAAQLEFRSRDPQPGSYPCIAEDGSQVPNLDILPGRQYSFGGAAGSYTVDITGRQNDSSSAVDFVGGPFDGRFAFYSGDIDSGLRSMSVSRAVDLTCDIVVAPTPAPKYGAAPAPRSRRVKGGLTGMFAAYQVDVLGVCSGLCWSFYTFAPNGYVYTREPDLARSDAACGRTHPNGLPVCERYRIRGRTIQIGSADPVPFVRTKQGVRINGRLYRTVQRLPSGARLTGKYVTQNFFPNPAPGTGGVVTQRTYIFTPAGRFERQGFAGATYTPPAGQPGVGVTVASQNGTSGTYRIVDGNTLQLRFDNGVVRRIFTFLPQGRTPRPELLHLADGDYLPK